MKNILIVITNQYPYGTSETFLETESHFWSAFDQVILCPLFGCPSQAIREVNIDKRKLSLVPPPLSISMGQKILGACSLLFQKCFWKEIPVLLRKSHNVLSSFKELVSFSFIPRVVSRNLITKTNSLIPANSNIVIYSYWLHYEASVATHFKKKHPSSFAVSRCHGFDLYEERHKGYIPYREHFLKHLDRIYCISEDGKTYLNNRFPQYKNKVLVSFLGTSSSGYSPHQRISNTIRIVSCSHCVPVKRVDLIINALSGLSSPAATIEWTHFGGGPLLNELQQLASKTLPRNVISHFVGHVENKEILSAYKNGNFDVFVNVSSSEGIPVSIMEAMSYGIPTIATDVGGTSEIVESGINGFLLDKDFSADALCQLLLAFLEMPDERYSGFSKNAYCTWEKKYNAQKNYRSFINDILSTSQE